VAQATPGRGIAQVTDNLEHFFLHATPFLTSSEELSCLCWAYASQFLCAQLLAKDTGGALVFSASGGAVRNTRKYDLSDLTKSESALASYSEFLQAAC